MAFQQDTSGQDYSPDPSSRSQKGLGSRLRLICVICNSYGHACMGDMEIACGVVSQARPNQSHRGSLSVSRTESDPRWDWLGLACETSARGMSSLKTSSWGMVLCLRPLRLQVVSRARLSPRVRVWPARLLPGSGGRVWSRERDSVKLARETSLQGLRRMTVNVI